MVLAVSALLVEPSVEPATRRCRTQRHTPAGYKGIWIFEMVYKEFTVPLNITADAYRHLYRGAARNVLAHDLQGRKIQFPAAALRRFVTHEGIRGTFVIRVDEHNRLAGIRRVDDESA
jgi:hypothetical protein